MCNCMLPLRAQTYHIPPDKDVDRKQGTRATSGASGTSFGSWGSFFFPKERSVKIQRDRGPRSQLDLANREKDAQGGCGTSAGRSLPVKAAIRKPAAEDEIGPTLVPVGVSPSLASSGPRRFPRRSGPPICGRLPFLPSPTSAACQIPLPVPRKAARHAPAKSSLPRIPPR